MKYNQYTRCPKWLSPTTPYLKSNSQSRVLDVSDVYLDVHFILVNVKR